MSAIGKSGALLAGLLLSQACLSDISATTQDGKKVLLNANGTWHYLAKTERPSGIDLQLVLRRSSPTGCRFGLRMTNHLNTQIRTLVLRFTAFKRGDIPYQTVSRGYSGINPTGSQYQEVHFRGIRCDQIDKVQVDASRNCHVGELTQYTASEESCLELVDVKPSDRVTLFKKPGAAPR